MADNLLDKASILLTPTAYNDGSMLSIKPENGDGDFTFSRSSAATRVNAQGLVENVQIISSELVSNGNFSQIGTEEVSNGNFSQEGSELVTNGDFATDSDWTLTQAIISNGSASFATTDGSFAGIRQTVFSVGKTYLISLDVSNLVGTIEVNTNGGASIGLDITTDGTKSFYMKAESVDIEIKRKFGAEQVISATIDNVSVKEVGQDWSLESGWSIGDGSLVANSVTTGLAFQSNIVEANKSYKATYSVVVTSGSVGLYFDGGTGYQGVVTTTQTITVFFKATTTSPLYFRSNTSNFTGSITNISVKEVGQDWILGTGWSMGDDKAVFDTTSNASLLTNLSISSGNLYRLKIEGEVTSGNLKLSGSSGLGNNEVISLPFEQDILHDGGGNTVEIRTIGSAEGFVTNVSVKEITDDTDLPRINYEGFSYQDSLGSEEIVNGGFATDSGWVTQSGWSISGGTANCDGTANNALRQNFSLPVGTLRIKFDVTARTQGIVNLWINKPAFTQLISADAIGSYEVDVVTTSGANNVFFYSASNFTGSIDNVSVKEVLGQEVVPDSGCGSWLLEPQSTNLITQSELFSDAVWTKSGTTVTSGFLSPDGTTNAFKLVEGTNNGIHQLKAIGINTVVDRYNFSVFVKPNGRNEIRIVGTNYFSSGTDAYFNLETKVIIYGARAENGLIETLANGWFRCSFSSSGGEFAGNNAHMNIETALNNSNSYQGDGTSGVYIFGAMVEQNSFSTSYIPTSGAASTRLQDIANNSGNSTLINSTEGVLYAEIAALSSPVDSPKNITISDGTVNNYVRIEYYQDGRVYGNVYDGTSVAANFVVNQLNFNKVAIQYSSSGSKLYVNGTGVDFASKIFTSNTLNTIQFSSAAADSNYFYGKTQSTSSLQRSINRCKSKKPYISKSSCNNV